MRLLRIENLQLVIFLSVIVIMIISGVVVFSASVRYSEILSTRNDPTDFAMKHLTKIALAVIVMMVVSRIPYKNWKEYTHIFMITAVILLIAVLFIGTEKKGAVRSIDLRLFELQPSFFALLAMILHFARLIEKKGERVKDFKTGFLPMIGWILIIAFLIFLQPNFSQGMVVIFVGMILMFIGGAQIKHLFFTILAGLPFILVYVFSAEYRYQRMANYLKRILSTSLEDPDPQVRYSIFAIGSGGLFGVGFGNSRYRELFIPEAHTDFIFSIFAEELGFIGSLILLLIYILIFVAGIIMIKKLNDTYAQIVTAGIISSLVVYVLANTLVVVGVLPTTGLPLPFMSYGGSSLIIFAIAIGILMNFASTIKAEEQTRPEIFIYRPDL
jgi:cell division protein FtsW